MGIQGMEKKRVIKQGQQTTECALSMKAICKPKMKIGKSVVHSDHGKSDHVNHEKDKQISKDLFVITNDCMRDHRTNHGGHKQATGIKQKGKRRIGQD